MLSMTSQISLLLYVDKLVGKNESMISLYGERRESY